MKARNPWRVGEKYSRAWRSGARADARVSITTRGSWVKYSRPAGKFSQEAAHTWAPIRISDSSCSRRRRASKPNMTSGRLPGLLYLQDLYKVWALLGVGAEAALPEVDQGGRHLGTHGPGQRLALDRHTGQDLQKRTRGQQASAAGLPKARASFHPSPMACPPGPR